MYVFIIKKDDSTCSDCLFLLRSERETVDNSMFNPLINYYTKNTFGYFEYRNKSRKALRHIFSRRVGHQRRYVLSIKAGIRSGSQGN